MQITLTSKEFDEAVSLWLQDQGFNTDTHSISTRVIAGRSDGPLGTRLEVTLDAKPKATTSVFESMDIDVSKLDMSLHRLGMKAIEDSRTSTFSQRASQGHANE